MHKTALNIPDCHIPWEDKTSYGIMLHIAQDFEKQYGLDEINIMGDFLDFYWFSLHPKMPSVTSVKETLKEEIYQGIQRLEELRNLFPKAKINYIEGNHEYRMVRYIISKCPELFDLFSLEDLLQFKKFDIQYIPFGKTQLHRCLGTTYLLRHQPFNGGKHCAASSAHNKGVSLGFGHTHRKQAYTFRDALRKEISCYSLGWLGDRAAPPFDYMDTDDWAQSFQFVHAFGEDDWFVENIDIKNHKAVFNGYIYTK